MKQKQPVKPEPVKTRLKTQPKQQQEEVDEEAEGFDFGGLPKDVPFKRNIGCGG